LVEWIDAGRTVAGIAHADDLYRPKDGFQRARAETAMRVQHFAGFLLNAECRSDISIAALLQMRLKQQTLHLAAFGLLLSLNVVEREP